MEQKRTACLVNGKIYTSFGAALKDYPEGRGLEDDGHAQWELFRKQGWLTVGNTTYRLINEGTTVGELVQHSICDFRRP